MFSKGVILGALLNVICKALAACDIFNVFKVFI